MTERVAQDSAVGLDSHIETVIASPYAPALVASVRFIRSIDALRHRLAGSLGINRTENEAVTLVAESGTLTPKDLSRRLEMTTGSVTALLDRLEAQDILHRLPNPEDRRSSLIKLTDAGAQVAESNYVEYEHLLGRVAESRSAEELAIVTAFFEDLAESFTTAPLERDARDSRGATS